MINIDIDYIFFNLVLLGTFTFAGINITKKQNYWENAIYCIAVFTFVLGSRYLRGNDYEHYCEVYLFNEEESQWIFTAFNNILKYIGVGPHYFYYYYSFIFITCALLFLKRYKSIASHLFPTFIIAFLVFDEFMIRQALSFSFVFLYLNELFDIKIENKEIVVWKTQINDIVPKESERKKRYETKMEIRNLGFVQKCIRFINQDNAQHIILCIIFSAIALSIHVANVIILFMMTILYFFRRSPIPYFLSIPLLLIAAYVFNKIYDLSYLNPILNILAGHDEKLDIYLENDSAWFSEEAQEEQYSRSPAILLFEMAGNSALFYYGNIFIKKTKKWKRSLSVLYNTFILGTIVIVAFRNLEILNRIGYIFQCFWCFPLAFVLFFYKHLNLNIYQRLGLLLLVFWSYDYIKALLMRPDMTLFLWDSPYFIF